MATELKMPQMGYDMEEGTVVRWLKEEGSAVNRNEAIAEIETDKAIVEFESDSEGVLLKIIAPEVYNQLFTMHATTMIFLAIMPLSAAFFNFIIPLQIGARDVAFPRLNAFSYWAFLAGALIMKSSWFLGGSPNAGWFGYAPITTATFNPGTGIDFWVIGL